MQNGSLDKLLWAVVQTVTYSDIFDYPLTAREIHRYLTGVNAAVEEVALALQQAPVMNTGEYFTLPGREEISKIRTQREKCSRELLPIAIRYGRILGALPYIRMVALTGSLAVLNISKNADFDYMLVTSTGRMWMARAFAVTFGRIMRLFGHRICINLLVSENALAWHRHDLYTAREICQMIPVTGMSVYQRLRVENAWTQDVFPNAELSPPNLIPISARDNPKIIQYLLEVVLRGTLGAWLERWTMKFQLLRMARKYGASDEIIFSVDVCQANFHQHRRVTQEAFQRKLATFGVESEVTATQV